MLQVSKWFGWGAMLFVIVLRRKRFFLRQLFPHYPAKFGSVTSKFLRFRS